MMIIVKMQVTAFVNNKGAKYFLDAELIVRSIIH